MLRFICKLCQRNKKLWLFLLAEDVGITSVFTAADRKLNCMSQSSQNFYGSTYTYWSSGQRAADWQGKATPREERFEMIGNFSKGQQETVSLNRESEKEQKRR